MLISNDQILTNDLILLELIPFLKVKNHNKVIRLLHNVKNLKLDINWDELINIQTSCLKKGVNGVGIPDLIIAQNALQNECFLFTLDPHFSLIKSVYPIELVK